MSKLEEDIRKAELSVRPGKPLYVLVVSAILAGVLGGLVYWLVSDLPSVSAIEGYVPMESSKVYSSEGKVLAEFYYERRTFVPSYQIPEHVKKAFVAIEDVRFYSHPGVDLIGILRALVQDIKARSMVQGGSTITQQLAKMLFLKPEKSIIRKVKEALISIQIERRYTKDEIIGLYLNQAYFGTRAFGIEAASQAYFGKSAAQLSVSEAALLASLPKAPSQYSPFKNPQKAKDRREAVLGSMLKHKFITQDQYAVAIKEPLPEAPFYRKYEAPYFMEILRQHLEQKYGTSIYTAGYKIYSTINLNLQHLAEKALIEGVKNIEKREKPGVQAALIAIDIRTGQIKAMIGGFDFWQTQFNRATQALRQPGSAFKPFVYATAIKNGMTSTDVITDAPISFKGARPGQMWSPKNYDGKYHGTVTLRTALAKSLNTATVRLASRVGIKDIIATARQLGIESPLEPYLPLALGASDVTLVDIVRAYSAFSTGKKMELISYKRIENRDKIVLEELYPKQTEVLDENTVKEMLILLGAVVTEGTATRAKELGRPVYGKTGTTNDYSDAWFVGFDERLAVGVWVGRDNHKPIGNKETGSMAALPIWIEFMKQAATDTPAVK